MTPRLPIVCFLALLAVGCDTTRTASSGLPFAGTTVTVVVPPKHGYRESWEAALNDWSDQTGATVDLQEADATPASAPPGSLVVVPATQLAEWVAAKALAPMPGATRSSVAESVGEAATTGVPGLGWDEAFLGLRDRLGSPAHTPSVIPISTPTLVLYYRSDLLAKAQRTPPRTWDEYHQLVSDLPLWAPGKTVAEPWSEEFRATMFLARAMPAAQHPGHHAPFFDADLMTPLIANEAYVRTLEQTARMLSNLPETSRDFVLKATPEACRAELLAGRAALAIAWEPGPGTATPRAEGISIGVARLPGSKEAFNPSRRTWDPAEGDGVHQVTLVGFAGWVAVVKYGGSEIQRDAAWNLAGRLWNAEALAPQPAGTFGPFREADLADPSRFAGEGLLSSEAEAYGFAVAESLRDRRVVVELPLLGRDEYRRALADGLTNALKGSQKPEDALRKVDDAWRDITSRLGEDKVRDSYRRFLGLSR